MNIFEEYLKEITALILKNQKFLELKDLNKFKGVTVEVPPAEFNFELSCNVSLVLGKINKTNPKELANKIKYLIIKNLKVFNSVEIADQKFNEYLEGLTYEDMYGTFNEETGNFSGMVESFIGADGERKQIPYPPDKNLDAVGILEALNIDKETVGVSPDYNVNDRTPFDIRFFQNENFTGTDDFYVEGRDV